MILIPSVPIFLILVSLSITAGRIMDRHDERTFNIHGILLCRNGELFPENKEIVITQWSRSEGTTMASNGPIFEQQVTVSKDGHFTVDFPVFFPPDDEEITEIAIHFLDDNMHCSKHELQYTDFKIEDQEDNYVGKAEKVMYVQ
uniref:Uncharacterized protein n=1 Tax=Romanomermis culicivorax TaxID=13658 RepID=A0A915JEN1_ROMCU